MYKYNYISAIVFLLLLMANFGLSESMGKPSSDQLISKVLKREDKKILIAVYNIGDYPVFISKSYSLFKCELHFGDAKKISFAPSGVTVSPLLEEDFNYLKPVKLTSLDQDGFNEILEKKRAKLYWIILDKNNIKNAKKITYEFNVKIFDLVGGDFVDVNLNGVFVGEQK